MHLFIYMICKKLSNCGTYYAFKNYFLFFMLDKKGSHGLMVRESDS